MFVLKAPDTNDANWLYTKTGRSICLSPERTVVVSKEDADALKIAGWTAVETVTT
jgi:hypothetical protein